MQAILTVLLAFFTGLLIMPFVIKLVTKNNVVDKPGGRKIHKEIIPSMGGIGIFAAILVGLLVGLDLNHWQNLSYILVAVTLMFLLGLQDDRVELSARYKLLGQMLAVSVILIGDVRISSFYGFLGIYELPLGLSYFLTGFVIIGLTNAFNLIDGVDGLAGLLSLVSFLFLAIWFLATGYLAFGLVSLACVGGVLAFLAFNWHPAKIFMGDTGSLTLGFLLAILSVLFVEANGKQISHHHYFHFNAPITAGLALVLVSCFDTLRVVIKRLKNGRPPMAADKSHIHHFLMRAGLRHDQVAIVLGFVKISFLGLMVTLSSFSDMILLPLLLGSVTLLCLFLDAVTLRKVKQIARETPGVLVLEEEEGIQSENLNSPSKLQKEPA